MQARPPWCKVSSGLYDYPMRPPRPAPRPAHLADFVAEELRRHVRGARLAPGARIGTERELVARFGVSRTVVREAVARLRSDGLVESRQGAGLFVSRGAGRRAFRLAARDARLHDAFELRFAVEVAAASLAATRRSRDDLAVLRRALADMVRAEGRVEADRRFHAAVASATGNALYASFLAFLSDELGAAIREAVEHTARHLPASVGDVLEEHREILVAIEAGAPERARAAMAGHLENAQRRLGTDDHAPLHVAADPRRHAG